MVKPQKANVSRKMDLLIGLMQKNQLKITPQRLELARWIFQVQEHFTIEDIIESFHKKKGQKVSTATIYRMVQMMLDLDLLIEHNFWKEKKVYEHTPDNPHHDHIICNDCGKIFEFLDINMEENKKNIAQEHGFKMTFHSLNIYGDCMRKDCEHKKKGTQKKTHT